MANWMQIITFEHHGSLHVELLKSSSASKHLTGHNKVEQTSNLVSYFTYDLAECFSSFLHTIWHCGAIQVAQLTNKWS